MVFSHNDLISNNVLLLKKNGKAVLIDYEYACYNFSFYDLANYFE
jgi:thiamine kinase-like enzyme